MLFVRMIFKIIFATMIHLIQETYKRISQAALTMKVTKTKQYEDR